MKPLRLVHAGWPALVADLVIIDADLARIHIIKAGQQIRDGTLARSRTANKGQSLASRECEVNIAQCRGIFGWVSEGYIFNLNITFNTLGTTVP